LEEYYIIFKTYANEYHNDIKNRKYESSENINEIIDNEIINDISMVTSKKINIKLSK